MEAQRTVPSDEAQQKANKCGCTYVEASAKVINFENFLKNFIWIKINIYKYIFVHILFIDSIKCWWSKIKYNSKKYYWFIFNF